MFYSNHVLNFKQLIISAGKYKKVSNFPCVFFEDRDEIVSIFMRPYENYDELQTDGHGDSLQLAVIGQEQTFFIVSLIILLQNFVNLRFKLVPFNDLETSYNYTIWHKNVILLRDMLGMSSLEPLPYRRSAHHLYYKANENSYSPLFFLHTFSTSLWLFFFGFIVFIFGCFWMEAKLIGKRRNLLKLFDFVSLILGNHIQIGNITLSYRILLLSLLILLIILYAAFGALLDVLLAIKPIDLPFENINEVLSRKDYTICMIQSSQVAEYVKYAVKDVNGKVTTNSQYCPQTDRNSLHWVYDPAFRCKNRKLIFFFDENKSKIEDFLIKRCKLAKFPGSYFNVHVTFVTSLEFVYKEILSQKILLARTSGNVDYIVNTAYKKTFPTVKPSIDYNHVEIEFEHCKLIIIILLIGSIVSFGILIIEFVWKRRQNSRVIYY